MGRLTPLRACILQRVRFLRLLGFREGARLFILWRALILVGVDVAFSDHELLVHVELAFRDLAHGHEVGVDNGYLQNTVEAVDPEVSLLGRGREEQEAACVCLQLESEGPRGRLAVKLGNRLDPLDADNLASTKQLHRQLHHSHNERLVLT